MLNSKGDSGDSHLVPDLSRKQIFPVQLDDGLWESYIHTHICVFFVFTLKMYPKICVFLSVFIFIRNEH